MSDFEFFNLGKDAAGHIDEHRRVATAKVYATTGKINANGSVTVVDSGATSHVWVKINDNQAETKSVLNKKTGVDRHKAGGIGVWLVWIEAERIYEIDSLASASNLTTLDASLLSNFEAPTMAGDLKQDTTPNASLKNIRVRVYLDPVTGTYGLTVFIEAGPFYVGTTEYFWPGGPLDLTASVPSAGMKAPVIIGIDSATLTAVAYKGTEIVQSLPPAGSPYFFGADFVAARNAATGFDAALFGIGLLYGQTAITDQADFVDLRAEQTSGGGGSGDVNGPASSTDRAIATWNGTGGTDLFDNPNATVNASGGAKVATLQVGAASLAASAVAEFDSTTQGLLIPAMTTAQRNAIGSPADGLLVYDVTLHQLFQYQAGAWVAFGVSGTGSLTVSDGTHSVAAATNLTLSGALVGGTTPNATASFPLSKLYPAAFMR